MDWGTEQGMGRGYLTMWPVSANKKNYVQLCALRSQR